MAEQPAAGRSQIVVAIDGPAGAGKSSVAKALAVRLGYRLLDTGALYRAVALIGRRRGVAWGDEEALAEIARELDVGFQFEDGDNHVFLGDEDVSAAIRAPEISEGASQVSALPAVRSGLLDLQRRLGEGGGVVAEGRDVGTVVFPDAAAKFFLTASPDVRAMRRYEEMISVGSVVEFNETLKEIRRRDDRDSKREIAPLARADDAVVIDSTGIGLDEVVERMLEVVRSRESEGGSAPAADGGS